MSKHLGEFLTAINYTKEPLLDDPDREKDFPAYITRRLLSYHIDAALPAAHMNLYHNLPEKMQFDYLRLSMPKRKRFSKFAKQEKEFGDRVKLISEFYDLSYEKSKDLVGILSDDDFAEIKAKMYRGGKK